MVVGDCTGKGWPPEGVWLPGACLRMVQPVRLSMDGAGLAAKWSTDFAGRGVLVMQWATPTFSEKKTNGRCVVVVKKVEWGKGGRGQE